MEQSFWRKVLAGAAGGLVAWWSVDRFYRLARVSSRAHSLAPYCLGAGIGVTYGVFFLRGNVSSIARVPLGAAIYLAEPERTAPPSKGGRNVSEKAGNLALRLASRGLKKAVESAFSLRNG